MQYVPQFLVVYSVSLFASGTYHKAHARLKHCMMPRVLVRVKTLLGVSATANYGRQRQNTCTDATQYERVAL